MVPALIETIKEAGLVLVSDAAVGPEDESEAVREREQREREGWVMMPESVNGVMKSNGVLRFNESIDM